MRDKCILILFMLTVFGVKATASLDSLLIQLDQCIVQCDNYIKQKEDKIEAIKHILTLPSLTQDQQFDTYLRLFEEYKSFKYDSAYVYANKSLDLANEIGNNEFRVLANQSVVFCLMSSGLFKEAFDIMEHIDVAKMSDHIKKEYYNLWARLYYDIADYSNEDPFRNLYIEKGNLYSDSVLQVLSMQSLEWWHAYGLQQMKKENFPRAAQAFTTLINMQGIDEHVYAMTTSSLAYVYQLMGDRENAKVNLVYAAIGDIKSVTKETTAIRNLANLLYETGDINRANRYIRIAMDDANFYNARHRKLEISSILPIIEKDRFEAIEKQRNILVWFVISVTLLFLLLLIATLVIYRQNKKLTSARKTIEERNYQLQETNQQLSEVSNIKDAYLGYSFYINSEYIDKIEDLYKLVNRKIAARQYDDLRSRFKESDLQKERKNMYVSFDDTFLKLFPTFISSYNNLFKPEDRIIENDKQLTIEMRIFALIRLGISDSDRIARILDYSVNTINTYKTKVKNKSIVANELFEQNIMEIRSGTV